MTPTFRLIAVSLPSRGASIEVLLGYSGTALTRLGRYTVDEVELSGPPDTLVIRGKATVVPRADQLNESDFNFITRLARQYDCTAKPGRAQAARFWTRSP